MQATIKPRYSDQDLAEFKANIEQLLDKENARLEKLNESLEDIKEALLEDNDWMDNMSSQADFSLYQTMVQRQKQTIHDYQNALLRIQYKTYGVCAITGELIDKKRLLVMPTTTKSVAAQLKPLQTQHKMTTGPSVAPKPKGEPVIISRVIKKTSPVPVSTVADEDEEDYDDDYLDLMNQDSEDNDMDSYASEDY